MSQKQSVFPQNMHTKRMHQKKNPLPNSVKGFYAKSSLPDEDFIVGSSYMYNQLLVVRNECFCTTIRQVSRLKDHHICRLPGLPVALGICSLITVTSSYRTCTCFPFHRNQHICIVPTPHCPIFNCREFITFYFSRQLFILSVIILRKTVLTCRSKRHLLIL